MRRLKGSCIAVVVLLVVELLAPLSSHASRHRKYKAPPPMATLVVTVLRAEDSKPLQNAAVVFHPEQGDKNEGNMELKTNKDGKTSIDVIPMHSDVLVQVIANGYQTYGQQYRLEGDKKAILIKLLPPKKQQFSLYNNSHASDDVHTNVPQSQMGSASPADTPLLAAPDKKDK
jgi:hypothetical protein